MILGDWWHNTDFYSAVCFILVVSGLVPVHEGPLLTWMFGQVLVRDRRSQLMDPPRSRHLLPLLQALVQITLSPNFHLTSALTLCGTLGHCDLIMP